MSGGIKTDSSEAPASPANQVRVKPAFSAIALAAILMLLVACEQQKSALSPDVEAEPDPLEQGKLMQANDRLDEALRLYQKAEEKLSRSQNSERYAEVLARIARILVIRGQLEKAEPLTKKCLAIALDKSKRSDYHGELLVSLDDLASTYREKAGGAEEIRYLETALELMDRPFEGKHDRYRETLFKLAVACILSKDREKADRYSKLALQHRAAYEDYMRLSISYEVAGYKAKAREYLDIAVGKLKHKKVARRAAHFDRLRLLADYYRENGRLDDAESVLLQVINGKGIPDKRRDVAGCYETLAYIYAARGEREQAVNSFENSIRFQRRHAGRRKKLLRRRLEAYYRFLRKNKLDNRAAQVDAEILAIRKDDPRSINFSKGMKPISK